MKSLFSLILILCFFSAKANPAQQQEDIRIERQKVLRAADQLEVLLPQMESLKNEVQALKTQMSRLQLENATLTKSLSALENSRAKERDAILDEVSKILAESHSNPSKPITKSITKPATKTSTNLTATSTTTTKSVITTTNQTTKEQVGYEHIVGAGQTVSSIVKAFNEAGVKVTASDIIKANNLGPDAKVRLGQKLFIPKK